MKRMFYASLPVVLLCVAFFAACATTGPISLDTCLKMVKAITRAAPAVAKTFQDITPEQEYYIGRAVGATIVSKYKPYNSARANHYLNILGQTLAQASDNPETFGGYHFLILDTDEVNAFAAPGGLIFVSRGMLRCCKSEDAVASVLAHEIGHIQNHHGLSAIQKGRITTALAILATESVKAFGRSELAKLTEAFEGSIHDITTTLVNNGYSRELERQADAAAVLILQRVGYNPSALVEMLEEMKNYLKPGGLDFAKTHPSPDSRIEDIKKLIGAYHPTSPIPARQARFTRTVGNI